MKAMRGWVLLGVSLAALGVNACGGDDDSPVVRRGADGGSDAKSDGRADSSTSPDGRADARTADNRDSATTLDASDSRTTDGSPGDAGDGGSPVQRGEYLVRHVGACGDCHTPINLVTGQPDNSRFLAGMPGTFQVPGLGPDGGPGIMGSKNLTPDMTTGLGAWTDAQIKKAFLDGVDRDGNALFPIMPYYVLHNMSDDDASAIVAYLRTVPPIDSTIPPKNFAYPAAAASPPVPASRIPNPVLPVTDPAYASAMRGKYLAGNFGVCMECHTKHVQTPGAVPLDLDKLFAGGQAFDAASIGLPSSFPVRTIFTENITPHSTGIQGWTAAAVAKAIKDGIEKDGLPLCPPMPSGPNQAFNGITDRDALDIGNYITHLPPIDNTVALVCHDAISGDGGPRDGGDASTGDAPPPPEGGSDSATPDAPAPDATPDAPAPDATPDVAPDNAADTGGDRANDGTGGDATDGAPGDGSDGSDGSTDGDASGDGTGDASG
jgi:hypothetical protein